MPRFFYYPPSLQGLKEMLHFLSYFSQGEASLSRDLCGYSHHILKMHQSCEDRGSHVIRHSPGKGLGPEEEVPRTSCQMFYIRRIFIFQHPWVRPQAQPGSWLCYIAPAPPPAPAPPAQPQPHPHPQGCGPGMTPVAKLSRNFCILDHLLSNFLLPDLAGLHLLTSLPLPP